VKPEISLVLVSYEMAREIPRTLRSLSPAYQHNATADRCEVILVDNGSREPPRIEMFVDLGMNLSVHHIADASQSPVAAANLGIARARAPLIGVWVDGARMASPGLVDACARAARLHPRPVIATGNHHLGPAPQYISMMAGYDRAEEDRLLQSIGWPTGGRRLFEIGTPDRWGSTDGPMLESNALFMPRAIWDEIGGYDPRFTGPGGGATNPDVFIRACALPDVQLIKVAGEATFHQLHGGVVSNAKERVALAFKAASQEYFRIRARPLAPVRTRSWLFDPASDTVTY
jgi:hypothetical protein